MSEILEIGAEDGTLITLEKDSSEDVDLDIEENSDIPKDYSGMSGGGIWRAKFHCDEMKEKFEIDNIIFMGVNFFQTSINRRKLIGHGSKSIYELLYQHVINTA